MIRTSKRKTFLFYSNNTKDCFQALWFSIIIYDTLMEVKIISLKIMYSISTNQELLWIGKNTILFIVQYKHINILKLREFFSFWKCYNFLCCGQLCAKVFKNEYHYAHISIIFLPIWCGETWKNTYTQFSGHIFFLNTIEVIIAIIQNKVESILKKEVIFRALTDVVISLFILLTWKIRSNGYLKKSGRKNSIWVIRFKKSFILYNYFYVWTFREI